MIPTLPLNEEFSRAMLLLHYPGWYRITDIKPNDVTWTAKMTEFISSDDCPNFVKAAVERAKEKPADDNETDESEELQPSGQIDQPDWMDLIRPLPNFDNLSEEDFAYDDGGLNYDWTKRSFEYPETAPTWMDKLDSSLQQDTDKLNLPDVNITKLNEGQHFVFNLVMKTLTDYDENFPHFQPLHLIVGGTAGSASLCLLNLW